VNKSILYCGDTDLNSAASYLAGMMATWGWTFDYVPSHIPMSAKLLDRPRSLLILSDYPAAQFDAQLQQRALKLIEQGCGLLMIGGWESFHGFGGDWDKTPLGSILPVTISSTDDRTNFDQSAWLTPVADHPILQSLPWLSRPPAIGGMNRVTAKAAGHVILKAQTFDVAVSGSEASQWTHSARDAYPALVVGHHGLGRTAAFMSDVAPHWVGGFVDWGLPRVTGQALPTRDRPDDSELDPIANPADPRPGQTLPTRERPSYSEPDSIANPADPRPGHAGAVAIEVGSHYAQFWKQLLAWTSGTSDA